MVEDQPDVTPAYCDTRVGVSSLWAAPAMTIDASGVWQANATPSRQDRRPGMPGRSGIADGTGHSA